MQMSRRSFLAGAAAGMSLLALGACGQSKPQAASSDSSSSTKKDSKDSSKDQDSKKPQPKADEEGTLTQPLDNGYNSGTHHAKIDIKDHGTITVELNADAAPISVSNFADLANAGFYDGLTFHRIIKDFMMQGGDPKGDGTGGAKRTIKGEFLKNGVKNKLVHTRGTISMARSNQPNSASSQFFIMQKTNSSLDGQYAAFGHVTDGMNIVDDICNSTPVTDDNGTVKKDKQPIINSIKMID